MYRRRLLAATGGAVVAASTRARAEEPVDIALVLATFADSEEVAAALDAYLALPMRYWGYAGLMVFPEFDRHRGHPAMQALSRKYADEGAAP